MIELYNQIHLLPVHKKVYDTTTEDELSIVEAMPMTVRQRCQTDMADSLRNAANCAMFPVHQNAAFANETQLKYEMFCKWLKMCQSDEFLETSEDLDSSLLKDSTKSELDAGVVDSSPLIRHVSEDDDDEFVDTESNMESLTSAPTIVEVFQPELQSACMDSSENNFDIDMKVVNISPCSSMSDLSGESGRSPRPTVTHKKRHAPPVPTISTKAASDADESKLNSMKSLSDDDLSPRRHTGKEKKKKKNMLRYLPGIFKPLSPSSSSYNVNHNRTEDKEHDGPYETLI